MNFPFGQHDSRSSGRYRCVHSVEGWGDVLVDVVFVQIQEVWSIKAEYLDRAASAKRPVSRRRGPLAFSVLAEWPELDVEDRIFGSRVNEKGHLRGWRGLLWHQGSAAGLERELVVLPAPVASRTSEHQVRPG